MPEPHPDADNLARYLSGEATPTEGEQVERHLAGCAACRRRLRALAARRDETDPGAVLQNAATLESDRIPEVLRELTAATARLAELLALPEEEREPAVADPRFHLLKLCDLLEAATREAWTHDPRAAVELAGLAVAIADRLDPAHYGGWLVQDARALAWGHLGNAWRVASDLRRGEEALEAAWRHHRQGDEDALTEALLLSFTASLHTSRGRFGEAIGLLDRAAAIYREARDPHLEGKTLIKKATALGHDGQLEEAIRLVRRGLSRIDLGEEPRLLVAARHNLVFYLSESGRHEEALKVLAETRRMYLGLGDPLHLVRLRWLEGRVALNQGRLEEAEAALVEARDAFIERGIGFDAAFVSLDLATVYLRQRRTVEVKRLASEMVPIFESRDVHQEASAALLVFREAAQTERVTASLLDRLATFLTRARYDPELRFDAEG